MKILLKIAAFCAVAGLAQAQALPAATPGDTGAIAQVENQPSPDNQPLVLPEERRWRLGAALGYGQRSNPLVQSEDIPVVIDLDVAYFGDHWFFDNGDLGLQLVDNAVFTTNLVARLNSDRAFFGKTNKRYVNYSLLAGGALAPLNNPETGELVSEPQLLEPPDRDYAVELGFESLFGGEWGQATLRAFHDVSGTHEGYEISADYSYRVTRGRFSFSPMVGVSWKSASLSNYYWGVHKEEVSATLAAYEVRGGVGWETGVRANYYLSKSLRLAVSANYERLQYSVAQSPLVKQDHVFGYFAGLGWQF
jgi:outer membrane protein